MSLYAWAAGLSRRKTWPLRSGCTNSKRPGWTVGANPRAADDAAKMAVALIRGVARIPSGPDRARECSVRRAKIAHGIQLVIRSLQASKQAFRTQSSEAGGWLPLVLLEHSRRLRWATSMTNALQTASRTLETLDSFNRPELEYSQITEQLSLIKEILREFSDVVGNLDEAAPGKSPMKMAAAVPCVPQAEKLEALSDTCRTSAGEMSSCCSEACSEDSCDTPRLCPWVDMESALEVWPEARADLAASSFGEKCEGEAEEEESPLGTLWYDVLYWG